MLGEEKWKRNKEVIDEVFSYQNLRMPRMNIKEKKIEFNYNIAEYMFYFGTSRRIKLRKFKNTIKTVNIKQNIYILQYFFQYFFKKNDSRINNKFCVKLFI